MRYADSMQEHTIFLLEDGVFSFQGASGLTASSGNSISSTSPAFVAGSDCKPNSRSRVSSNVARSLTPRIRTPRSVRACTLCRREVQIPRMRCSGSTWCGDNPVVCPQEEECVARE